METSKDKARIIEGALNDITFQPSEVACDMQRMHRTLQQNFTALCIEWLRVCASEQYQYDDRNEASHIIAKEIMQNTNI